MVASRLQVLATEHWSLLATRSLTYTGAAAFALAMVLLGVWGRRSVRGLSPTLAARFPSPRP